ncbi:putative acid phosphatase of HAD superfamily subfamily IIIB [Streptomyces sp. 1114.5]|uniref:HAD family acid phosphatase n=1 Tax=Streptomyces sp. 1114.5 TaxID=1938830 RepID=UPI000EB37190|nr:HAD family acid phosphatase [Streptomyces sp. 1114.5]RKT09608.1 putative acid phosphatase of HAD superfamily subfamily IIIB [Streptomyces sp. 1114.5]
MSIKAKLVATVALTAAITAGLAAPAVAAPAAPAPAVSAAAPAVAAGSSVSEQQWLADVTAAIAPARAYIEQRTATPKAGEKPAIVFDIDNTTLATHFHPFTMPGIAPVVELAQYAHARGVTIIFVTARPGFIESVTRYSLQKAGYTVDELRGRDLGDLTKPVQQYKTEERIKVENEGYTIVASVGNNWTDLNGGHAEKTFKLPDYDGLLS